MKTEVVDIPIGKTKGKYDEIWNQLLSLKTGQALKLTDTAETDKTNFKSIVSCLWERAAAVKGRRVKFQHMAAGKSVYLWLSPNGGSRVPSSVVAEILQD